MSFPEEIVTFTKMEDVNAQTDGAAILKYQKDLGNKASAAKLEEDLASIADYDKKFINAALINKITGVITDMQNYFVSNGFQDSLNNAKTDWETQYNNLKYAGVYNSTTTYYRNNFVLYNDELYIRIGTVSTKGKLPTNTDYWRLFSVVGAQGESGIGLAFKGLWKSQDTYTVSDVVNHATAVWVALQPSTNIEPTTNASQYWNKIYDCKQDSYALSTSMPTPSPSMKSETIWFEIVG